MWIICYANDVFYCIVLPYMRIWFCFTPAVPKWGALIQEELLPKKRYRHICGYSYELIACNLCIYIYR